MSLVSFMPLHGSQISAIPMSAISATNFLSKVEPHAAQLENLAAEMEAAGIGGDPNNGHAVVLRKMAGQMRADAAQGRMPSALRAAAPAPGASKALASALRACRDAGVVVPDSGKFASLEQLNAELDRAFDKAMPLSLDKRMQLKAQISAAGMLAEDTGPDQKSQKVALLMLAKLGTALPPRERFTLHEINAAMDKAKLSIDHRMEVKTALANAGFLENSAIQSETPTPSAHHLRSIFAQVGIDAPAHGAKVSIGKLNQAMAANGFSMERKISVKSTLASAGLID
jgi:hypothetical protein